jgi:hypothetical protein
MRAYKKAQYIHGYFIDRDGPEKARARLVAVEAAKRLEAALNGGTNALRAFVSKDGAQIQNPARLLQARD